MAPHMEQYLDYVNKDLGYPPSQERADELASKLPINIYVEGPDTSFSTNNKPLNLEGLHFKQIRGDKLQPEIYIGEHHRRTVLKNQTREYSMYYELEHRSAQERRRGVMVKPLMILGLMLGGCYLVVRRLLRPVHDIKQAVQLMGAGKLETRVPVRSNNDLGALSSSINSMAADIQKLLDSKRQLLLGASHELRTPITRATVAAKMLPESQNRTRIIEDLQEMESLIADIMESERITGGHTALNLEAVDVTLQIANVLEDMHHPVVTTDLAQHLPAIDADAVKIRLLLRNLLSNALEHGASDRPPVIKTSVNGKSIVITFTDYGPGISPDHLSDITEPFYRADPSRARNTGGFGLGLHLCDLIVQAHNGEMTIENHYITESDTPEGTRVTVMFPTQ